MNDILINIELTTSCIADCYMCPRKNMNRKGFMKIETVKKIQERINDYCDKIWEVDFSGRGEPTRHPLFYEISSILKTISKPLAVVTTGENLTESVFQAFGDNLDKIRLSVSSIIQDDFLKVHRGLNYKQTWDNIRIIADNFASKTVVHLTGGEPILESLPETVEYLKELGFSEFYIFPLWNRGGSTEFNSDRIKRQNYIEKLGIKSSETEYLDSSDFTNGCPIANKSIFILNDGDVLSCFQDFKASSISGNIFLNDLLEIENLKKKQTGCLDICKNCNSKKEII